MKAGPSIICRFLRRSNAFDGLRVGLAAVGLRSRIALAISDDERAQIAQVRDELESRTIPLEQAVTSAICC